MMKRIESAKQVLGLGRSGVSLTPSAIRYKRKIIEVLRIMIPWYLAGSSQFDG